MTITPFSTSPDLFRAYGSEDEDAGGNVVRSVYLHAPDLTLKLNPVTGCYAPVSAVEHAALVAGIATEMQLAAVEDLAVTADGEDTLDVTWTAVAARPYELRIGDETGVYHTVVTVTPGDTSGAYSITGLTTGTARFCQIRAIGNGTSTIDSEWSDEETGETD